MLTYEIIVKYNTTNSYPTISWKQFTEPTEHEILQNLKKYSVMYNIPEIILEEKGIVFVDAEENGLISDPEIYQIDFSILKLLVN